MDLILMPRRSGKTLRLIERAAKDGGIIVCKDHKTCQEIIQRAQNMGREISRVMTYDNLLRDGLCGMPMEFIHIDDIQDLLWFIARGRGIIGAVTCTPNSIATLPELQDVVDGGSRS